MGTSLLGPYFQSLSISGAELGAYFDFHEGVDPYGGVVVYQNVATELFVTDGDLFAYAKLETDSVNVFGERNRPSLWLESQQSWDEGLFLVKFDRMPEPACGLSSTFAAHGEFGDVTFIEGRNLHDTNVISAYSTVDGCTLDSIASSGDFFGQITGEDCSGEGCSFIDADQSSFDSEWNAGGGGIYAVELTRTRINLWRWNAGRIPADVAAEQPDPSLWGPPVASFGGPSCSPGAHFGRMSFNFKLDVCGPDSDADWSSFPECTSTGYKSCSERAGLVPADLLDVYFQISWFKVFVRDDTIIDPPEILPTATTDDIIPTEPPITEVTTSSAEPEPTPVRRLQHTAFAGFYTFSHCYQSSSQFPGFDLAELDPEEALTPEKCAVACIPNKRFGLYDNNCYCGGDLDEETRITAEENCDVPCPGNDRLRCGGDVQSLDITRQSPTPRCDRCIWHR